MAKQINFFMNEIKQNDFIDFLDCEGYLFLPDRPFSSLCKLEKNNIDNEYSICLYKSSFGIINPSQIKNTTEFFIDKSYNPIIEYWIPHIKHSDKSIRSGRIWLTSYDFYDLNSDRLIINNEYSKLVSWIKKNVPYQNVIGYSQKMYICDDLVDLVYSSGYMLK